MCFGGFVVRKLLVTVLFILCVAGASIVVLQPGARANTPGFAAMAALFLGWGLGGRWIWRKPGFAGAVLVLSAVVALPAVVIARGFGRVDMMSVLFHTGLGIEGAGIRGLRQEIIEGSLALIMLVAAVVALTNLWALGKTPLYVAASLLLVTNPFSQFLMLALIQPAVASHLPENMVLPLGQGPKDVGDIVVVYIEGSDRQFADPAVWGDVYAPLDDLARQGLSLTGVRQVAGTGWSLAGVIASQCGVPALPRGVLSGNNYKDVFAFMPKIRCLTDFLADRDYAQAVFSGGKMEFAGANHFFNTHGVTDLTGRVEMEASLPADEVTHARVDWVLDDKLLLRTAGGKYAVMAQNAAPLAIFVQTSGPHGRTGYLSHRCSDSGQAEESEDIARVLACTIADVTRFVADIRAAQAQYRPGRALHIVLLSDHLNHNTAANPTVAPEFTGANTVIILGPNVTPGQINAREASMMDLFPTLLQVLGLATEPVAANLGRSVLSAPRTLRESTLAPDLDDMLNRDGKLAAMVWAE